MLEGIRGGIDTADIGGVRGEAGRASLEHGIARMGMWIFPEFSSVRMGNL